MAWVYLGVAVLMAVVYATGVFDESVYPIMLSATCVSVAFGVHRNRPSTRWHWWAFILATLLWSAAGIVRNNVQATGVMTSSRSLLPDVFAMPAYAVVAIAMTGLLRSRQRGRGCRNEWLDGAVVALAGLLIAWVFAVGPTLSDADAWLPAQLAVAVYPPVSACLAILACRLAFGTAKRSASHQMVFVGTLCLLVGEIAFATEEVGTLSMGRLYELPFLISSAVFGAAALHPSMRHLSRPVIERNAILSNTRVIMLAGALLLPALVVVAAPAATGAAKWFLAVNLCLLALAAAARLLFTVRRLSQSESILTYQATHDELTGLPNRNLALDHISDRLQRNETTGAALAVMFADLDQFKLINDSMGHAVGDELLVAAAARLRMAVRDEDMVARISGDEFLIVCDQVDAELAQTLSERTRRAFADSFELSGGRHFVTTSIGVAMTERGTLADGRSLMRDADTAMYRSKLAGRNTITFFGVEMRQRVERRVLLERQMRAALDAGEIVPHFQPLVTLPAGHVEGFEALARWSRPDHIPPSEFIPVAEESGLIVALGATILDQACEQLAEWRRSVPGAADSYVAVNLSPRQILESDIVQTVSEVLERRGLPGQALWLEITESVLMEDTVETQNVLRELSALGVSLSVDDFGTGYSSLSYLNKYPIGKVKIDKSFVDRLDEQGADHSLVAAIIAMATALNLKTIAEGVERVGQANRLFELGCTNAQGFYFGPPMPAEEVSEMAIALGFATPESRSRPTTDDPTATPDTAASLPAATPHVPPNVPMSSQPMR